MTIKQANNWAIQELKNKKIFSAYLDAEVLLCYVINVSPKNTGQASVSQVSKISKEWIYSNLEFRLPLTVYNKYKKLVERRARYEPIAYIIGHKEFYGLDFYVTRDVLIPRPETELVVEKVMKEIGIMNKELGISIVDVGTGSGCIAVALAKHLQCFKSSKKINVTKKDDRWKLLQQKENSPKYLPKYLPKYFPFKIYATDISKKALDIAKLNARKHNFQNKITFLQGNLLEPFGAKHYLSCRPICRTDRQTGELCANIIVANLPYISNQEMKKIPNDIKKYEPKIALCGGKKGLDLYEKLLFQSRKILKKNGKIFLEISNQQSSLIKKIAKKYFPNHNIEITKDYSGLDRIVLISS